MADKCNKIKDHLEQGLGLLISQYKGRSRIEGWLTANLNQIQSVEDAIFEICSAFFIESAVGDQLDKLGAIVGQARFGLSDDAYRILILSKIAINKSSGTGPDVIEVLQLIDPDAVYTEKYPATICISLTVDLSDAQIRSIYKTQLTKARAAGIAMCIKDTTLGGEFPFRFSDSGPGLPTYGSPNGFENGKFIGLVK